MLFADSPLLQKLQQLSCDEMWFTKEYIRPLVKPDVPDRMKDFVLYPSGNSLFLLGIVKNGFVMMNLSNAHDPWTLFPLTYTTPDYICVSSERYISSFCKHYLFTDSLLFSLVSSYYPSSPTVSIHTGLFIDVASRSVVPIDKTLDTTQKLVEVLELHIGWDFFSVTAKVTHNIAAYCMGVHDGEKWDITKWPHEIVQCTVDSLTGILTTIPSMANP